MPLPQENLGPVYDKALVPLSLFMKACKKCGEVKKLEEFYNHKTNLDGKMGSCKKCYNDRIDGYQSKPEVKARRKKRDQSPEAKARHRKYDQTPEAKARKAAQAKVHNQKPEVKAKAKKRAQTPETKAQQKEYNQRSEVKARTKDYNKKHKQLPEVKAQNNKRFKERYANDPLFRFACNMRSRIRDGLKGYSKSKRTEKFLYCTFAEAMDLLEKQFRSPMTRENMGEVWEVDHIIPISSFDLSDPEQVKICFHYTNLQPLFIEENRTKSNKTPEEWAAYCALTPKS
jgi:hypothetical protein